MGSGVCVVTGMGIYKFLTVNVKVTLVKIRVYLSWRKNLGNIVQTNLFGEFATDLWNLLSLFYECPRIRQSQVQPVFSHLGL